MESETRSTAARISGVVRLMLVIGVLILATIALLVVFEVMPLSVLRDTAIKTVLAVVILGIAGAAIVLLSQPKKE